MLHMYVYMHSRFVENYRFGSWTTDPSFLSWFCHTVHLQYQTDGSRAITFK
jgi:hypothetical protein